MLKLPTRVRGSEIQGLQFVRANAVLLVVLCHAAAVLGLPEYFNREFLGGILDNGAVGVDIFFILSGFIIVHVALKKATLEAKTGVGDFLLKRFVRIVPFLWVCVIAYAVFRFIGAREFEWQPYLNAMTLFPVGEVRPNVVWSLRHEALFYVLFAVSFLLRKRAPYILYAWCLAPAALWLFSVTFGVDLPTDEWFVFVFNPRANVMFGCGVLIGMLCQKYGLPRRPISTKPMIAWGVLTAATFLAFIGRDSWNIVLVVLACAATVIAGLVTPNSGRPLARVWELLGDASYSIYLTHNIFVLLGGKVWMVIVGQWGFEVAILALSVFAVVGGTVVHLWVEKPLLSAARRLINKHKGRSRGAHVELARDSSNTGKG